MRVLVEVPKGSSCDRLGDSVAVASARANEVNVSLFPRRAASISSSGLPSTEYPIA
jgi:hypothetical protein